MLLRIPPDTCITTKPESRVSEMKFMRRISNYTATTKKELSAVVAIPQISIKIATEFHP
jgi:hypothetical protein